MPSADVRGSGTTGSDVSKLACSGTVKFADGVVTSSYWSGQRDTGLECEREGHTAAVACGGCSGPRCHLHSSWSPSLPAKTVCTAHIKTPRCYGPDLMVA